jgi:PilZ domain
MSEPTASLHANGTTARRAERRGAVRHSCSFDTACHPVPEGVDLCAARVQDISTTGVGLLVDRYVEPETFLGLDLQSEDESLAYTLLVQVRHAQARGEAEWFLGCAFARELSEYELEALL